MVESTKNGKLNTAKKEKNDEFYTQLSDIEKELRRYRDQFKGKRVFCNCDDPTWSNFWKYFYLNFEFFGLDSLVSTHYNENGGSYKLETFDGVNVVQTDLIGNGDFRSDECVAILETVDIVATNPPFSLFREFVAQLIEYDKQFIILGNQNAITYKEIFPLIKENKLWLGYHSNKVLEFEVPEHYPLVGSKTRRDPETGKGYVSVSGISWFTNMDIAKRHEDIILYKTYNPDEYPKYDNYDAIEVSRVANIPVDYDGVMGVPITFLDKFSPNQFEIVGSDFYVNLGYLPELVNPDWVGKLDRGYLGGRRMYSRILIKKKAGK